MDAQTRTWRIGELARQTGVTVRTLHHYDRLGLLSPSSRTAGGHRCYTGEDVVRLQRIIALRGCGLSLDEIGSVLSDGADGDLARLLSDQLDVVDERLRQTAVLRARLLGILDGLARRIEPSVEEILRLIEETTTMNQPITAQQLAQLKTKRVRQLQEMSAETRAVLAAKMQQACTERSSEALAELVERRRVRASTGTES